jgi:hypothetical protein
MKCSVTLPTVGYETAIEECERRRIKRKRKRSVSLVSS